MGCRGADFPQTLKLGGGKEAKKNRGKKGKKKKEKGKEKKGKV